MNASNDTEFNLGPRYQFVKYLGKGAYGVVGELIDTKTNERVAIKKIPLASNHMEYAEQVIDSKKILREIMIMYNFKHNNIINLRHVMVRKEDKCLWLFLVLDLMDADLRKAIRNSELLDDHIQYIMYQIFLGLQYLHSGSVVHRDIKPNNILVNEECKVVLCDFGFAREAEGIDSLMTEYVVTRIYRAPEIVLCPRNYSKAVDIWAIGCTMFELLTKTVLFNAGNYKELIMMIVKTLGSPTEDDLAFITRESARKFLQSLPFHTPSKPSMKIHNYPNKQALDLLDRCLTFDPNKRISAEEALKHPYFANFYNPQHISHFNKPIDFSFELNEHIDLAQILNLIFIQINLINQQIGEEMIPSEKFKI
jgi:serine/threonine protein kinase